MCSTLEKRTLALQVTRTAHACRFPAFSPVRHYGDSAVSYALIGLLAIAIHVILNASLLARKAALLRPEERMFRAFIYSLLAYHVSDALWGFFYEERLVRLLFLDTEIYFVAMACSILFWTKLVLLYLKENNAFSTALHIVGLAFWVTQILAVGANAFTPVLFSLDANGAYQALWLRHASLWVQMGIFLTTSCYALTLAARAVDRMRRRHVAVGLSGLVMLLAIAVQYLYPLQPVYSLGCLLCGCVLHTFVLVKEKDEYSARHDELTDLPNAVHLNEQLDESLRTYAQGHGSLGLAIFDLDNFKNVNNCYGHAQGDAILCQVAQRLRDLFPLRHLARTNSDSFRVILTATRRNLLVAQAKSLLSSFEDPFELQGNRVYVSASLGLAISEEDDDAMNLVNKAELAMFAAKEHGGNHLSVFHKRLSEVAFDRKQLENALHQAVTHHELSVHYQPQVDTTSEAVVGCEALVRWQRRDGRYISPADFIPLAEKTGMVTQIDMFVLRAACRQALAWQKAGIAHVPIAVNMSVHSILSADFVERVLHILEEEGTPPQLIELEITETSFLSDQETASKAIDRLHAAGLNIALDDFGTGYSSLQYLSALPVSALKIDRQFVLDIASGKESALALVRSIISLAANLRLEIISEGVETAAQLKFLADNGAHIIQGFLFSRPLKPEDCEEFLRHARERIESAKQPA